MSGPIRIVVIARLTTITNTVKMYEVCLCKFTQHEDLKKKLLETGDAELIEGNYWHGCYWGVCEEQGENRLGKILMRIREELRYK